MSSFPLNRRQLMAASAGVIVAALATSRSAAAPKRLLLVHGRDQQGLDPARLTAEWMEALSQGVDASGGRLPDGVQVAFPFYGDKLDEFSRALDIPLTSDIHARGDQTQDEFLEFQAQVAQDLRVKAGITDAQVNLEYGTNPKPKGPQNWEWVQAIIRAIDKYGGGMSQSSLEIFTRDVFLYTTRAGVRDAIDEMVASDLTEEPTVVVAHSLGSIVAYNVLRSDRRRLQIPLLITVGCPLGIRAIRNQLKPLRYPPPIGGWFNAFDDRDLVALYALDATNFPVTPAIENYSKVKNRTNNRHGIVGYLDDQIVAERILATLGT
jgi:hypothetical protein